MSEKELNIDIDSLLDGTLDDLADIPAFRPYPVGAHRVKVAFAPHAEKKNIFYFNMEGIESVELTNPKDEPIKQGDKANIMMDLTNEFGQGNFKLLLAAFKKHFGEGTPRELMEKAAGSECLVVTGVRKDKNDAAKLYTSIINIEVI